MTTPRRLSAHLLVFVILLAGFAATGLWRYIDYAVYRAVYLDAPEDIEVATNLLIIDLPYRADDSDNDPTEYRLRLADLLGVVAARERQHPQALILDVWISNDSRGLRELQDAIVRLRERPAGAVDVYAVFNPNAEGRREAGPLWREHAQDLYRYNLKGYGHSALNQFMGVLSYETEMAIPTDAGGTEYIRALPTKVAIDLDRLSESAAGETVVLPVGSEAAMASRTVAFVHSGTHTSDGRFFASRAATEPVELNLDRKIVVIGSVIEDRHRDAPQAGPNLIAWALNDQLRAGTNARQPLNNPALVLGQVVSFALLTSLVFALLFKYVTRLQTSPVLTACLSVVTSAAALALVAAATLALNHVAPVGLTLFAVALTGVLAWHFARTFLATGVAEGSGKYDAFISYSRGQGEWVAKNVYEPLRVVRKADGSPLSIFFDRAEIGLGEAFTAKYMWAIVDSRFFIPVFSDDYYSKNHTRNEMDVAYRRLVEKKIAILPIVRSSAPVPEIYSHLHYLDADANPGFIEDIRKIILGASSA